MNNKGYFLNDLATDTVIIASLRRTAEQLNQVSKSANEVVENLNATTAKLNNNNSAVGVLLSDETAGTNVQNTLINLESSTKKLDENMEAMQHTFLLRGYFRKRTKAEEKRYNDSVKNANQKN